MTEDASANSRSTESDCDELSRRAFLSTVALTSPSAATGRPAPSGVATRGEPDASAGASIVENVGQSNETQTETTIGGGAQTPDGNQTTSGGGGQVAETLQFGGKVQGWQGTESFQGPNTNPTIQLQAGQRYRVRWKNLDGAPHNFTIRDANGNNITSTSTVASQGQVVSLTFTASENMAQYICTIHPNTMVGDVRITGGGGGGGGNATGGADTQGGGGQQFVPDTASLVAMLWTAALALTVGLSAFILKYFDDHREP